MAAPNQKQALINGVRHSFSSVTFNFLGRDFTGITELSYKEKQNVEKHYGAGKYPTHYGYGTIESEASMSLYGYEVDLMIQAATAAGKNIFEIMFDINVVYRPTGNDPLITHVVHNCIITEHGRDLKQGDTSIVESIPMVCSHITR